MMLEKNLTPLYAGEKISGSRGLGENIRTENHHPCPLPLPLKSEIVDPNHGLFLLMGLGTRLEGSMNKMWNHIFNGKRHAEFDIL